MMSKICRLSLLLFAGLCLLAPTSMTSPNRHIYVNPISGGDNVECYNSNNANVSCKSLSWALNVTHRTNSMQYVLSNDTHYLSEHVPTFENLTDISIVGNSNSSQTVIKCIANQTGLAFQYVLGVKFLNVTFSNCSCLRDSTSKNFHEFSKNGTYSMYTFQVALYFYSCQNVSMNFVNVNHSPGATGVVMYNTVGTNTISNSVFSDNCVDNNDRERPYPGGGGFYVEFTYCIPGDKNCWKNQDKVKSYFPHNTNSQYTFSNCLFKNNRANNSDTGSDNSTYIVPFRADHEAFGRGGGLSFFVKGNASKNSFTISNCTFTNNSALWGAGLFVEFHDDTFDNKVEVMDCEMTDNYCYFGIDSGTGGGGMRIGHYVYGNRNDPTSIIRHGNHIILNRCHFENNAALDGGGLSISPTVQYGSPDQVAIIDIIESTFENNLAKLGAAIHIDRFVMILNGFIVDVNIANCTFDNNTVEYTNYIQNNFHITYNAFQMGVGTVYVNQVPVSFNSNVNFTGNSGSAIAAVGTSLNFTDCSARFLGNKGNKGGALALLGAAYLIINDNTAMIFERNKATLYGGAIYNKYIERENLVSYTNCFIRHVSYSLRPESWKSTFSFIFNTDQGGGRASAIYTTSILPCSRAGGSGISKNTTVIFCWNSSRWDYQPSNCTEQIFSDVGAIVFPNENETCNRVEAFPGREFPLPINIKDDLVSEIGKQTIFGVSSNLNHSLVSYVWNERATLNAKENETVSLQLDSLGDRIWQVNIDVELQPCPPGFKSNDNQTMCVCSGPYVRAIICEYQEFKAYLTQGNWMGRVPDNDTYYFVSFCPPKYCTSSARTLLPNTSSKLEEEICGENNRRDVLCGECLPGFGVAVNSPTYDCIECPDGVRSANVAKYLAAVYIPLIALFTAIIIFNIRLTSGPANAFILYCQVVAGTFDLDADGQIPVSRIVHNNHTAYNLVQAYKVLYGIFNLQFVERFIHPLCLGFQNTLDVLLLDYTVALSPLVMILIVLLAFKMKEWCVKVCTQRRKIRRGIRQVPHFGTSRPKWNISSAILPAFAAFLLLSYTKFSTTSSYMLLSQPLFDENGNSIGSYRVYLAGQFETNNGTYMKTYLLPALIVYSTFVAIPPLLLLDFPKKIFEWIISRFDCLWRQYPAVKVQILLDTFQGCYKNKMRFFSGLYFVFRLVINTSYVGTHNWYDQYLVQQIACIVMVALLAICQPYNDNYKIFNTVDILIFTNLGILNALSNYLLSQSDPFQHSVPKFAFIAQYILLYLPLLYMLMYIVWILMSPCKQHIKQRVVQLKTGFINKLFGGRFRPLEAVVGGGDREYTHTDSLGQSVDEEEALLRRAETRNLYRPYTTTIVGVDGTEGDASTIQTVNSENSGLRSVQTTPSTDYGSTGNSNSKTSTNEIK